MPPRRSLLPPSFVDIPAMSRTAERRPPSQGEASAAIADGASASASRRATPGGRAERRGREAAVMNAGLGIGAVPCH